MGKGRRGYILVTVLAFHPQREGGLPLLGYETNPLVRAIVCGSVPLPVRLRCGAAPYKVSYGRLGKAGRASLVRLLLVQKHKYSLRE